MVGGASKAAESKQEILKQLVEVSHPDMGAHNFELQTYYIVCLLCNQRVLRHSAKEKILELGLYVLG